MERLPQDTVIRPIVTEASMANIHIKKYTFEVAKDATKPEIAKAVEKLFGVSVESVNTIHMRGREKRLRNEPGYTASWKKAIVTLKPESKGIEFFEGMM